MKLSIDEAIDKLDALDGSEYVDLALDFPPCDDGELRGFPLESKYGVMYWHPVTADRGFVNNSSNTLPYRPGRPFVTVRGRDYLPNITVECSAETGLWEATSFYGDATPHAERLLRAEAEARVQEWADENPSILAVCEAVYANNEAWRARDDVRKAQEALTEAEAKLHDKLWRIEAARRVFEAVKA